MWVAINARSRYNRWNEIEDLFKVKVSSLKVARWRQHCLCLVGEKDAIWRSVKENQNLLGSTSRGFSPDQFMFDVMTQSAVGCICMRAGFSPARACARVSGSCAAFPEANFCRIGQNSVGVMTQMRVCVFSVCVCLRGVCVFARCVCVCEVCVCV